MRVRAKFSVSTALAVLITVAVIYGLFRFGRSDYAAGVGAVGVLLSALLPQLLKAGDKPVEVKVGKSDPPKAEESPLNTDYK